MVIINAPRPEIVFSSSVGLSRSRGYRPRCLSGIVLGILFAAATQALAGIIQAPSTSLVDVQSAVASALDGDTVIVPAGTASWASTLNITKSITLQGATTTTGSGSSMTANDQTVLQDNLPRNGTNPAFIHATLAPNQVFRLTGFTFAAGSLTTPGGGAVRVDGSCPNVRIDHCHFAALYQDPNIIIKGQIYGVFDHCRLDLGVGGAESFQIFHDGWGGYSFGDGSWADYPYFGTNRFFFLEDNFFNRSGLVAGGGLDCYGGGRYVARYNYFSNTSPNSHGTESSGRYRGTRAIELYNNTINWTVGPMPGSLRSGTLLTHDNTWTGNLVTRSPLIDCYREFYPFTFWGAANGNNALDLNDVSDQTGNGYSGGPNGLYASGTHAGANGSVTLNVPIGSPGNPTPGWTTNRWVGYELTNTTRLYNTGTEAGFHPSSYIVGNTGDTITFHVDKTIGPNSRGEYIYFNTGDGFAIYKLLVALDQPGRGKGTLITASNPQAAGSTWPNEALEPVYEWNNSQNGIEVPVLPKESTIQIGRDCYNLGLGFGSTTPAAVSSTYVAAVNGVDYIGPYTYPHPLVSGVLATPSAPSNLRVVP